MSAKQRSKDRAELHRRREKLGISRHALSLYWGYGKNYVRQLETGARGKPPRRLHFDALALLESLSEKERVRRIGEASKGA